MLDQNDKQWIESLRKQDREWLDNLRKKDREWMEDLRNQDRKWITNQFEDVIKVMADGFRAVGYRFDQMDHRFDSLEGRVEKLENRVGSLEQKFDWVENNIITKDYLDERLGIMKEKDKTIHSQLNIKIHRVVDVLDTHKLIGRKEANTIVSMEPFSQKLPS